MSLEDMIYVVCLLFSIGFGHFYREIRDPQKRRMVATFTGMILVLLVSGWDIIHPIIMILVNAAIVLKCPVKISQRVSFIFTFGYLMLYRVISWFGLPQPSDFNNCMVMMLALKLIGVASENQAYYEHLKKSQNPPPPSPSDGEVPLRKERIYLVLEKPPTFWDIWDYSFCYAGVLTGPYFKFRTYHDFIYKSHAYKAKHIPEVLNRIKYFPVFAAVFFIVSSYFPVEYALTEDFMTNQTFLYRIWYSNPVFLVFRMRFYVAFTLSELTLVMVGLGAYPAIAKSESAAGPTDVDALSRFDEREEGQEYDFNTVKNIDPWYSDFEPTVRGGMRFWNITVQHWLALNVYQKLKAPKPIRVAATMFVSSVWHGVHSGYYLSMLTVPFIMVVEDQWDRLVRRRLNRKVSDQWDRLVRRRLNQKGQYIYDWICWAFKMQWFGYMGMAFILLKASTTFLYWQSVFFYGHALIAVMYALGFQLTPFLRGGALDDKKAS
ncbi:unnamed protein product [Cyprideis torosa]|uniref:Lysophospholipid acyltransferase 7 n=1 Tax=Cyprideis torosa TaxID=163714 RepID=A0A7R8WFG0_9CRUS|nr:unnamed protein product [Cyprideis torosa]CAG0896922.1 unnamed protein product [Cyprideis torosa]